MLCSELCCSPDKPYLTRKGEVLLCCCIFEEQHLQYKMPRISDNSPKDPSLPNLDIVIRNRSVFPSHFSQKKWLWYGHETDALVTLQITTVLDFNSAQNCTMSLVLLCKLSCWSPEMSALLLLLKSTSKGDKVAKWFNLENLCCCQN